MIGKKYLFSKEFEDLYTYKGDDLGFTYTKEKTIFRVWAPLAEKVSLITYANGDINSFEKGTEYVMYRSVSGTWTVSLDGDQNGVFYTYKVKNPAREEVESGDPYAKAAGINGDRSAVVDLPSTNPPGWTSNKKPAFISMEDAIIYEVHIRDLAMDEGSGIKNRGKYIEFEETGTMGPNGISTGIDHIKELGVTHIHILPTFDFATVNEKAPELNEFNWGYDPKNYNVPEGSYATDPYKPHVRINEFKRMVKALHENKLRIVMDVVYNHTFDASSSHFEKILPGYYYRTNVDGTFMNGTGCGNETASERSMMRKYIVDSVKYWAREYHVDGFRFDLMGIHDIQTMNEIRNELNKIDPSIIIYGEGWDIGSLPRNLRAAQYHSASLPGISFFNDNIRDNLKGPWNDRFGHGYVDGRQNLELEIMEGITGSINYNDIVKDYNAFPYQSINYAASHDNNTLWDKLKAANPNESSENIARMHMLANTIIFSSQGVPFLHEGEDFLRTKYGHDNSYNQPDSINRLDWSKKAENMFVFNYYRGLTELRNSHPAFRMPTAEMIRTNITFISSPRNTVAFILGEHANNDSWKNIFAAFNANTASETINIPEANWAVVIKNEKAGTKVLDEFKGSRIVVPPLSAAVMCTDCHIEAVDLFAGKSIMKGRANSRRLSVNGIETTVSSNIVQKGEIIYFPAIDMAEKMGLNAKLDGTVIKISKGNDLITINGSNVSINNNDYKLIEPVIIMDGIVMVPRDFIERIFKAKVLVDYRRFTPFGTFENSWEPDIFVLY